MIDRFPPQTPHSIQAAKDEMLRQRNYVFQQTGVRINEQGRIVLPFEVPCGVCSFTASARTQGRALKMWAGHRLSVHPPTNAA
jgi:hypothetical protein